MSRRSSRLQPSARTTRSSGNASPEEQEIVELVDALLDASPVTAPKRGTRNNKNKAKSVEEELEEELEQELAEEEDDFEEELDIRQVMTPTPKDDVPPRSTIKSNLKLSKRAIGTPKKQVKFEQGGAAHFEFGGTPGALGIIFGLPLVIFLLYFASNEHVCLEFSSFSIDNFITSIKEGNYISEKAIYIYLGWLLFNVFLERVLPGERVEGAPLPNGKKLKYTLSGHLQFWICIVAMGHAIPYLEEKSGIWVFRGARPLPLEVIYDEYVGLITVSCVFCFVFSVWLYLISFSPNKILAKGGNTGYHIYDFFIGRELNPRVGSLDLKEFCELRPGLIGWLVINLGMCVKQYGKNGGSLSMSMLLVTLYQGFYVWDALYQERAILTTMDITTDGFGYMLAFGDLAWVPFIYSLQARYLVDYDPQLSSNQLLAISALHFVGLYIFRASNSQKDAFRRNPLDSSVAHLEYMETRRGTKLITSGWWGAARKINYTGDWLITLSWCLLCGFNSPVPYFQAVYFLVLLIHRAIRDDQMCAEKYGEDWLDYKEKVPYMFIPYVV